MTRSPVMILALLAAFPPVLSAQHGGTIELGGFARYGVYDDQLGLDDAVGYGGRLGLFLSGKLILEADGALAPAKTTAGGLDVDHIPAHLRLVGNLPFAKRMAFLIGGGYAFNNFADPFDAMEHGVGALAGLRINLGQRLAIRGDAIVDYMFSTDAPDPTLHYAGQVGVSLMLFSGPGDKDKDGVKDDVDRCEATPAATPVEATGCPDADRDGVANAGDRCANTATGRPVDAVGCSDSDGDGVVDPQDRCEATPAGTQVDATGCVPDADKDGVSDTLDQCASTPAGVRVDASNGCPVDADGDGVLNAQDTCPQTPPGVAVNSTGCPTDSDGDGVADATDACPGSTAGSNVDSRGCLVAAPAAAVVLTGVSFLSGSAKLTLNSMTPLNQAVAELQQRSDVRVLIEGHTDNTGDREANVRLSKARADAVRAYFISKGVAASRLTTVGIGPDQPVAANDTPEGRAKNRRVQLRVQP